MTQDKDTGFDLQRSVRSLIKNEELDDLHKVFQDIKYRFEEIFSPSLGDDQDRFSTVAVAFREIQTNRFQGKNNMAAGVAQILTNALFPKNQQVAPEIQAIVIACFEKYVNSLYKDIPDEEIFKPIVPILPKVIHHEKTHNEQAKTTTTDAIQFDGKPEHLKQMLSTSFQEVINRQMSMQDFFDDCIAPIYKNFWRHQPMHRTHNSSLKKARQNKENKQLGYTYKDGGFDQFISESIAKLIGGYVNKGNIYTALRRYGHAIAGKEAGTMQRRNVIQTISEELNAKEDEKNLFSIDDTIHYELQTHISELNAHLAQTNTFEDAIQIFCSWVRVFGEDDLAILYKNKKIQPPRIIQGCIYRDKNKILSTGKILLQLWIKDTKKSDFYDHTTINKLVQEVYRNSYKPKRNVPKISKNGLLSDKYVQKLQKMDDTTFVKELLKIWEEGSNMNRLIQNLVIARSSLHIDKSIVSDPDKLKAWLQEKSRDDSQNTQPTDQ